MSAVTRAFGGRGDGSVEIGRVPHTIMGRKKTSVSTAELLARGKKTIQSAVDDESWEAAAEMLAEEQAARDAKEAEEKAAVRVEEKARAVTEPPTAAPVAVAAASARKGKKKKTNDVPAAPPTATTADSRKDEIRRKVEAAQKARAAADAGNEMGTRETLAQERRQARAAQNAARNAAQVEEVNKPILAEATPSTANQQQPDETLEEWLACASGGFERLAVGYHPGVSCDRSGKLPIVGRRYQLQLSQLNRSFYPFGYDVCEDVWEEMPPEEQETYDCIEPVQYASDETPLLQPLKRHFAYEESGM